MAQLLGLLMMLAFISPQVRQLTSTIWVFVIWGIGIALLGLAVFFIFRITTQAKQSQVLADSPFTVRQVFSVEPTPAMPGSRMGFSQAFQDEATITDTPNSSGDLIEQLRTIDWFQFEKVVDLAYRKQGYTVSRRGGANPDGGIDLVISKDGKTYAVQCKQWKTWKSG